MKWAQSDLIVIQISLKRVVGKQSQNHLNCPEVLCKKDVFENCAKFRENNLCWSFFSIKLQASAQQLY